jgi:tetratricopeptide (TPR) repeat protein
MAVILLANAPESKYPSAAKFAAWLHLFLLWRPQHRLKRRKRRDGALPALRPARCFLKQIRPALVHAFFLPLFPVGSRRPLCECQNCHAQFRGSAEDLMKKAAASQQQQMQRAIQLYNSMRVSPANSVTLNELMLLYFRLGEFDQAVSAAREFPDALNASEQCMTTVGRVLMEQKKQAEAIQWFDAAIARNPMLGEAAYCKAVALMSLTPADLAGAEVAARSARTGGIAEAESLLREIEKRQRGG